MAPCISARLAFSNSNRQIKIALSLERTCHSFNHIDCTVTWWDEMRGVSAQMTLVEHCYHKLKAKNKEVFTCWVTQQEGLQY